MEEWAQAVRRFLLARAVEPGRAGAVGAEVEVLLGVELRVVLEAATPEAIGAEHERERGVRVVFAAAGAEVAVIEGEAEAGFAVFEQQALDGDGVGVMALHDGLDSRVRADGVLERRVAQICYVARVGANSPASSHHLSASHCRSSKRWLEIGKIASILWLQAQGPRQREAVRSEAECRRSDRQADAEEPSYLGIF
jgi:hypothetical protein